MGNRVQMSVDMIELAVWEMTLVRQFNFISEFVEYIGFRTMAGNHLICIKQHGPII